MLKTNILSVYENNHEELYKNAVQLNDQKQMQEYKNNFYPYINSNQGKIFNLK